MVLILKLALIYNLQTPLSELKLPLKLKWRKGNNLPFRMRGYPQAVVFNERVYIGGGVGTSDRERQTVVVYDSKQDSYDTLLPYTYKYFSIAVVNNQLVLVGGQDEQTRMVTNKLGVWNEQSLIWTHPLPPMTAACNSPSVTTHSNRWLVVIGGYTDGPTLSRVEILDTTESLQWYCAAALPQPCAQALPATIGNMCYLLGGYTTECKASKKVFSVCLDDLISQAVSSQPAGASAPPTPSPCIWQSLPDTPLEYSTALAFNGALLAVGGGTYGNTAIYHYQPSSESWIKVGDLPTERFDCTCIILPSGDLYVAGDLSAAQVDIASI